MKDLRIAAFLPSASEMVCELGLFAQLVGVSHECDYPPQVKTLPVVVRCAMDLSSLNLKQIDEAVSARVGQGQSVYAVDEEAIKKVKPNLIITQDLCQVCAPSGNEATQTLKSLDPKPEFLWQTPHSFENVLADLLALGEKTGTLEKARQLETRARARIETVKTKTQGLTPVKVFFMEWVDPIYCGGHWMPEMIGWAGGVDTISKPNVDSIRIAWEDVLKWDPEVLVISPCGYNTAKSLEQTELLKSRSNWNNL